jgi:hypothetical protein
MAYAAVAVLVLCAPLAYQLARDMRDARLTEQVDGSHLRAVARELTSRATPEETVMLEPLGVVGFYTPARFYDYPGLTAPAVTAAVKRIGRRIPLKPWDPAVMGPLLRDVRPDWLVLREDEYSRLDAAGTLAQYRLATVVRAPRVIGSFQDMYLLRRKLDQKQ